MNDHVWDIQPPKVIFITARGDIVEPADMWSVSSTRTLDNPVASASVMFWDDVFQDAAGYNGRRIVDVIRPYDLCKIQWVNRQSGNTETDGIFFVQSVTPSLRINPNGPERQTRVELLSLGEALMRYQIFYHPHLPERSNIGGIAFRVKSKGKLPQGRPDEVVRTLYDTFLDDNYIFKLPGNLSMKSAFLLKLQVIKESLATQALSAMSAEGSLWETLKRYADSPFNEFFVDFPHEGRDTSDDDQVFLFGTQEAIYLRPTPFSQANWDALAQSDAWGFSYDGSDLIADGEQIGPRLDGLANFFWVSGKSAYSAFDQLSRVYTQSNGKTPRYDEGSIRRFGLRRMEVSTEYVNFLSRDHAKVGRLDPSTQRAMQTTKGTFWEVLEQKAKDLHEWFGYPWFWGGSLTTVGRCGGNREHGARIGGILSNEQDKRQYYITGIAQNWNVMSPWTTSLTLSRGHIPKEWRAWWNKRKDQNPVTLEPDDGVESVR